MTLTDHLPILVVLVPMVMAPLVAVLPAGGRWPWALATASSAAAFLLAVLLAGRVADQGTLHYVLGGWPVPFGIGLAVGPISALMLLVITGASLAALLWGPSSMDREVGPEHQPLLYASWLLALCGLVGITVTNDAFNVFVFMEISSLASYVLVAAGPRRQALTASFKYLVTGTVGATFYLIGVGYLYMMTGTLNMSDMAARLADVGSTPPVLMAGGFILLGLAFKAALFPMHAWMPEAYRFAPTPVAVFMAACSTKVALFVLIRFDFLVLSPSLPDYTAVVTAVLLPLSVGAMLVGSAVAIFERDLKRMLGYSSVAQIGYILLAVSLASSAGLTAAMLHLFNHALIKGALFMAVGTLLLRTGSVRLDDLAGIGRTMPLTTLALCLAGVSLIGVPLTAGFVSKWYLIQAVLAQGSLGIWLLLPILASSLMAVVYVWKIVEVAYFQAPAPAAAAAAQRPRGELEAPLGMLILLGLLVAANFVFGLDSSLPLGLAEAEAGAMLRGRP
jgi:multicomponent Na+:H+ antiporter subunit D